MHGAKLLRERLLRCSTLEHIHAALRQERFSVNGESDRAFAAKRLLAVAPPRLLGQAGRATPHTPADAKHLSMLGDCARACVGCNPAAAPNVARPHLNAISEALAVTASTHQLQAGAAGGSRAVTSPALQAVEAYLLGVVEVAPKAAVSPAFCSILNSMQGLRFAPASLLEGLAARLPGTAPGVSGQLGGRPTPPLLDGFTPAAAAAVLWAADAAGRDPQGGPGSLVQLRLARHFAGVVEEGAGGAGAGRGDAGGVRRARQQEVSEGGGGLGSFEDVFMSGEGGVEAVAEGGVPHASSARQRRQRQEDAAVPTLLSTLGEWRLILAPLAGIGMQVCSGDGGSDNTLRCNQFASIAGRYLNALGADLAAHHAGGGSTPTPAPSSQAAAPTPLVPAWLPAADAWHSHMSAAVDLLLLCAELAHAPHAARPHSAAPLQPGQGAASRNTPSRGNTWVNRIPQPLIALIAEGLDCEAAWGDDQHQQQQQQGGTTNLRSPPTPPGPSLLRALVSGSARIPTPVVGGSHHQHHRHQQQQHGEGESAPTTTPFTALWQHLLGHHPPLLRALLQGFCPALLGCVSPPYPPRIPAAAPAATPMCPTAGTRLLRLAAEAVLGPASPTSASQQHHRHPLFPPLLECLLAGAGGWGGSEDTAHALLHAAPAIRSWAHASQGGTASAEALDTLRRFGDSLSSAPPSLCLAYASELGYPLLDHMASPAYRNFLEGPPTYPTPVIRTIIPWHALFGGDSSTPTSTSTTLLSACCLGKAGVALIRSPPMVSPQHNRANRTTTIRHIATPGLPTPGRGGAMPPLHLPAALQAAAPQGGVSAPLPQEGGVVPTLLWVWCASAEAAAAVASAGEDSLRWGALSRYLDFIESRWVGSATSEGVVRGVEMCSSPEAAVGVLSQAFVQAAGCYTELQRSCRIAAARGSGDMSQMQGDELLTRSNLILREGILEVLFDAVDLCFARRGLRFDTLGPLCDSLCTAAGKLRLGYTSHLSVLLAEHLARRPRDTFSLLNTNLLISAASRLETGDPQDSSTQSQHALSLYGTRPDEQTRHRDSTAFLKVLSERLLREAAEGGAGRRKGEGAAAPMLRRVNQLRLMQACVAVRFDSAALRDAVYRNVSEGGGAAVVSPALRDAFEAFGDERRWDRIRSGKKADRGGTGNR